MLYHPNSPYYQQFLSQQARGARGKVEACCNAPVVNAASAAQAKAANAEK